MNVYHDNNLMNARLENNYIIIMMMIMIITIFVLNSFKYHLSHSYPFCFIKNLSQHQLTEFHDDQFQYTLIVSPCLLTLNLIHFSVNWLNMVITWCSRVTFKQKGNMMKENDINNNKDETVNIFDALRPSYFPEFLLNFYFYQFTWNEFIIQSKHVDSEREENIDSENWISLKVQSQVSISKVILK